MRGGPNGPLTRLRATFDTRAEAQAFLDALQSNRRNGTEMVMRCWDTDIEVAA